MIGKIACFNVLSIQPLCQTEADAAKRIKDFVLLLREVRSHTGITKIRHAGDISKIQLTSGMTMMDYCSRHIHNPEIAALIWTIIQPQVDMDDDHTLTSYLETTTEINLPNGGKQIADGFNAAYCQQTFCIGFDSAPVWRNDFFDISVTSNGKIRQTQWACISSLDYYGTNPEGAMDSTIYKYYKVTESGREDLGSEKPEEVGSYIYAVILAEGDENYKPVTVEYNYHIQPTVNLTYDLNDDVTTGLTSEFGSSEIDYRGITVKFDKAKLAENALATLEKGGYIEIATPTLIKDKLSVAGDINFIRERDKFF